MQQPLRKLDNIEKWFIQQNVSVLNIASIVSHEKNKILEKEFVELASKLVTKKHQVLHVRCCQETLSWVPELHVRKQAIVETMRLKSVSDWEEAREEMLNNGSCLVDLKAGSRASWKLILVNFGDAPQMQKLVIAANHAVVDGTTSLVLLDEVLRWTVKLMSGAVDLEAELAKVQVVPMLQPTAEAVLPRSRRTAEDRKLYQAFMEKGYGENSALQIPFDFPAKETRPPRRAAVITLNGTPEGTQRMRAFCKKHGFTTGCVMASCLVQIAVAFTLARREEEEKKKKQQQEEERKQQQQKQQEGEEAVPMKTMMSVNARPWALNPIPLDRVGMMVTEINPTVGVTRDSKLIDVCSAMKQDIKKQFEVEKGWIYKLLAFDEAEEEEQEEEKPETYGDLEFGGIGKYAYSAFHGPFEITDVSGGTSACSLGFTLSVLVTSIGYTASNFLYDKSLLKTETVQKIARLFVKTIEAPCAETTTRELMSKL